MLVDVTGDWEAHVGSKWTPEHANEWLDWVDRRDIDRYLTAWLTAHHRGLPLIGGCRVRWPNGLVLRCRSVAQPLIADRQFHGLVGVTRHTVLD